MVRTLSFEEVKYPKHIAIIMDGNTRWARKKGVPTIVGHRQGAEALRRTVYYCAKLGIDYLTVFAFSSENWRRPKAWIDELMGLLIYYLKNEVRQLNKHNIRLKVIGKIEDFGDDVQELLVKTEAQTQHNKGLTLVIALNYGGRQDIIKACRAYVHHLLSAEGTREEYLKKSKTLDEQEFSQHLYTHDIPDPDLMIRTSGEIRLSNFLLWQLAYAELTFTEKFWPDFNETDIDEAIQEYQGRNRRYGAC